MENTSNTIVVAIAKQMMATTIVDNKALDEGVFKNQLGGLKRANKLFNPSITDVLEKFNKALWVQTVLR
ncbi:hypothetical protein MNBD_GAMMA09-2 [hydrothermal vent metagenome]|uniref:Uncharacterized protein n=1 Tax=hydrothermal vent metagenome TaxID=652676 RepID=A0A3B0XJT6_9ZZZZ